MRSNGTCKKHDLWYRVNSLPNEKFLDWSKLKVLADDKFNVTE